MPEPITTITVDVQHSEWDLDELHKYLPCDFIYYHSLCNRRDDYSEWMCGSMKEKDGKLFLSFDNNENMRDDIEVDSKLGREILAMSEM